MHPWFLPLVSLLLLIPPANGWLGIYLASSDEPVVAEVIPGSPAAKAGLRVGDQILAVDDQPTPTRDELIEAIGSKKVGDRVQLKLRRGDQEPVVIVSLA